LQRRCRREIRAFSSTCTIAIARGCATRAVLRNMRVRELARGDRRCWFSPIDQCAEDPISDGGTAFARAIDVTTKLQEVTP
jgi:hypothetical protein